MKLDLDTAEVFEPLLQPSRYKAAYGGRGSGKSHFFAEKLIEDSAAHPGENAGEGLRSICLREVQRDLTQSSKALIESKLSAHGIGEAQGFKVYKDCVATPADGLIIFKGMRDYTAESIKSLEHFKRAWWEEATGASVSSLGMLRPTIRAHGSELWFSWNPRRKSDAVDMLFRGAETPSGSVIVAANWRDNPWFTPELEQERQDCLRIDPDQYDHIWEGAYVSVITGAYYAKQLAECRAQGRICRLGRDPLLPIYAYWDIGGTGAKADACAIWIVQFVGKEIRCLRYYEAVGQELGEHVGWLRRNGFDKAICVLPHDGDNKDKVYRVSYKSELERAGFTVIVQPNLGAGAAITRIEKARSVFPQVSFDDEGTKAGREALGWYHEKKDKARNIGLGPEHDWSSHGADAFGAIAIDYEKRATKRWGDIQQPKMAIV